MSAGAVEWLRLAGLSTVDTVRTVTLPVLVLLWLLAWLEGSGRLALSRLLSRAGRWQPVYAAAVAAVPGCAGGILVSRRYVDGLLGPSALWAAHIATTGDASFVLLVGRPLVALGLFALLFVLGAAAGVLSGRARTALGAAGAVPAPPPAACPAPAPARAGEGLPLLALWGGVLAATWLLGQAAGGPSARWLGDLAGIAGACAVGLAVLVRGRIAGGEGEEAAPSAGQAALGAARQAARDAAEITLWVAAADFAFYAAQHLWGARLGLWLHGAGLPVILLAAAVGMLPGCGPQIFVARLYTAGSLPLAALLCNAVSQHGDAIFPLLGRHGRVAVQISLASAALAVLAGLLTGVLPGRV